MAITFSGYRGALYLVQSHLAIKKVTLTILLLVLTLDIMWSSLIKTYTLLYALENSNFLNEKLERELLRMLQMKIVHLFVFRILRKSFLY